MMRQLAKLDTVQKGWGADTSAVVIQEALLYQYNMHSLAGDAPNTDPEQLIPFYPDSSLGMDHPYIYLPGLGAGPRRLAAEDFAGFLMGPIARAEFAAAGLRDPDGQMLNGLSELDRKLQNQRGLSAHPIVPETVRAGDWPKATEVQRIQQLWKDNRKRAHVLILMDESLSMNKGDRMTQAKRALRTAVESWTTSNDRVALWGFSATKGDRSASVTRFLMNWHAGGASTALDKGIKTLKPRADTPLFRAIAAARDEVARQPSVDGDGEWANVVVVMSDGKDDFLSDSVSIAHSENNDVPVYAIAFDDEAKNAAADLRRIADRTHGGYQDATNPLAIDRAFSALIRVA
jgi:Mg-chelatase subunit ChlD